MKPSLALSLAIAAVATALLAARPAPQEVAPHLAAGSSVYGLVLTEPASARSLPELGPVEPVQIVGVRGHWALVQARGLTRGPVWINFDQVVSYRTNP